MHPLESADSRIRVLLADDDVPTRLEVGARLERDGRFHVCVQVADAARAVDAALRALPDLCVVEAGIPGGGISAVREIAARLPTTSIVMYTYSEDDADLLGALRAGAIGYLPKKDTDPRRLPDALADAAEGRAALPRALTTRAIRELRAPVLSRRRLAADDLRGQLTSREWEILELLSAGLTDAAVARRLVISRSTVRWHVHGIVKKLGLLDRDSLLRQFQTS